MRSKSKRLSTQAPEWLLYVTHLSRALGRSRNSLRANRRQLLTRRKREPDHAPLRALCHQGGEFALRRLNREILQFQPTTETTASPRLLIITSSFCNSFPFGFGGAIRSGSANVGPSSSRSTRRRAPSSPALAPGRSQPDPRGPEGQPRSPRHQYASIHVNLTATPRLRPRAQCVITAEQCGFTGDLRRRIRELRSQMKRVMSQLIRSALEPIAVSA
jgi:hypothetical protein